MNEKKKKMNNLPNELLYLILTLTEFPHLSHCLSQNSQFTNSMQSRMRLQMVVEPLQKIIPLESSSPIPHNNPTFNIHVSKSSFSHQSHNIQTTSKISIQKKPTPLQLLELSQLSSKSYTHPSTSWMGSKCSLPFSLGFVNWK